MPLEVRSQLIELNETGLFTFSGPVSPGNYVVGNSVMTLFYPNLQEYKVQNISLSLAHGMQSTDTVYVTVTGDMSDDQGHGADGQSRCTVNVVAWVGTADSPTVSMANLQGISASAPRTLNSPANTRQIFTFLSGLNVQLADAQDVTSYSAVTSWDVNSEGTITISGGSQLNGVHGTVDVGVLILTALDDAYQVFTTSCSTSWLGCRILFSPPINAAYANLSSFGSEYTHKKVIAMGAGITTFIGTPLPVDVIKAIFSVDIVGTGGGAEDPHANACMIGINGPSGIKDAFVPTSQALGLRELPRDERSSTP